MSSTGESSGWSFGRKKQQIQPGDGHPLKPFRMWQMLCRSAFYAPLETQDGQLKHYAVNVRYFDCDETAELYLNSVHQAPTTPPAGCTIAWRTSQAATSTSRWRRLN